MLHEFIAVNRDEIIRRCRATMATRSVPPPNKTDIDHGVPVFLDQVADVLRLGLISSSDIDKSAVQHGHDLLLQGFTVSQVVHDHSHYDSSFVLSHCLRLGKRVCSTSLAFLSTAIPRRGILPDPEQQPSPKLSKDRWVQWYPG